MKTTIQARLDLESQKILTHLVDRWGWTPSRVVREGLRLVALHHGGGTRRRIAGLGGFSSGFHDLGSNKKHLKDFGR